MNVLACDLLAKHYVKKNAERYYSMFISFNIKSFSNIVDYIRDVTDISILGDYIYFESYEYNVLHGMYITCRVPVPQNSVVNPDNVFRVYTHNVHRLVLSDYYRAIIYVRKTNSVELPKTHIVLMNYSGSRCMNLH
jgi:hypothetical protein